MQTKSRYVRRRLQSKSTAVRRGFADLPVGGKILTGYALVAGLMLVVIIYGVAALAQLAESERELVRTTNVRKAARQLDVDVLSIIVALEYFVDTRDSTLLQQLESRRQTSARLRDEIRRVSTRPVTLAALDAYETLLPKRRDLADRLIAAAGSDATDDEIARLRPERRELDDQAREFLRKIIADQETATANQQRVTHDRAAAVRRTMMIVSLIAIGFMVALTIAITKSITGPVRKLHQMTEQLGKGDFSIQNDIDTKDEIGDFARSLNAMAADVARLDRAKDEFIGLASHQLRTPATAVKNFIGLLKEGYAGELTDEQKSYVDQAWESNEQQLEIVDSLLRVARSDSGMIALKRQRIDLHSLVKRIIEQQTPTLVERRQRCRLYVPHSPVYAFADAEYLTMSVENLLSNASKYTWPGGRILIAVLGIDDSACIIVRDNGVGIAHGDIPRLFGKFSRIDNELSTQVGGNGIGLYLARRIIDLHEGSIDVDSLPGEGTAFTIRLPAKAE